MRFLRLNCFLLVSLIIVLGVSAYAQDIQILGDIQVDGVDSLALAPNTGIAYGIDKQEKKFYIFDLKNYAVKKTIRFPDSPHGIAVNPLNNLVYVTAQGSGRNGLLYVVDSEGVITQTITLPKDPEGIAVNAGNQTIAISIEKGKKLLVFSTENLSLLKEIQLPHRPDLISLDTDSNRAIVATEKSGKDKILIVDLNTGNILYEVRLEIDVDSIATDTGKDIAIAVASSSIKLFDINTGNILFVIPADDSRAVDINQSTHNAVIAKKNGFLIIDLNTNTMADYNLDHKLKLKSVAIDVFRNTALFGGKHSVTEIQLPNPKPIITNLIPVSARAGESGFPLKVEGSKFITTSSVQFNYNNVTTTFKNNNELEAFIPPALLTLPGAVPVTVTNPQPDGGVSDPFMFTIKYPIPVLESIVPNTIAAHSPDFTLKAFGLHFMPGYVVNFNGQDLATTYINPTELNAQVPSSLISTKGTYPVTVISTDRQNSNILNFTVTDPNPVITDFNPKQGLAGTVVTISGDNFNYAPTKIYFNGIQATIQSLTQTEIKTVVPIDASTGPIKVTTQIGSFETAESFKVLTRQDFELNISPLSISIPSYGSASSIVQIQSSGLEQFSGLVKLSVVNLPSGITARFSNEYVSSTSYSNLVLNLSSGFSQPFQITIAGTANIEGREITKTVLLILNPIPPGTTVLYGQVLASKDAKPIKGVTLRIGDKTTLTDDAGSFVIIDPPVGEQILLIDGHTANTALASYPSALPVPVTIIGGSANTLPYSIYLHEVNTKNFTVIDSSKDTIVTDPQIPDFQMTIPAGVVIIGLDGLPNERISVKPLSIDRLPIKSPPAGVYAKELYMYYFFKPGGGLPSQPIPVKMPNTFQGLPGTRVNLWYYDESFTPDPNSNQWKTFGMGTVSEDGKNIIPDPGVGIPKFCCGASFVSSPPSGDQPTPPDGTNCSAGGKGPGVADPVDPFNGRLTYVENDMSYPSPSMTSVTRYYKSDNPNIGSFGLGISTNFDYFLQGSSSVLAYITPQGGRYILSKNADETYTNSQYPFLKGAKAYLNVDGTRTLKFKNGYVFNFDTAGRLIEQSDNKDNWVNVRRDVNGYITEIYDSYGKNFYITNIGIRIGNINYTVISSVMDLSGREFKYTYDPSNVTLTSVTDTEGNTKTYTYSTNWLASIINKRNITELTNEYDSSGRVIKQTRADGGEFNISYTVVGGTVTETRVTDPKGNITTYRVNNSGYITELTNAYGLKAISDRSFGTNDLNSVTDPLGRTTTYVYDSNGNITSITDPVGNVTTYEYEPVFNKPTKITDALGNVTTIAYDPKGNLIQLRTPKGENTNISYNSNGLPISVTDALGNTTTFEYDTDGNMVKSTDPLGNSAEMEYDIVGRLISTTDPKGNVTVYSYDNMNRILEVLDALNGETKFTYDANSNLLTVIDAKNQTTTYTYNARDKVASMTDQLGKVETYTYDKNDNLISVIDRKSQTTTFIYDLMDRITKASYADGSSTDYVYDAVGRLTNINDSISGTIQYVYANNGCSTCGGAIDKVIQETTPLGSISYTYDAIGHRTSMTIAGQPTVNYQYDANSQLTNLATTINSQPSTFNFNYDSLGRRTSLSLPNGITTNYTYDNISNLLTLKHLNPLSQILESLNYSYDANGNKTSMNRLNVAPKLPTPASNITYNSANQMLTFNDKTIAYDNNGNMTTIINSCGTTNYTWDARNQLISISGFNADCSVLTAAFKYDALGRRIEKTINGKTTSYLYDGLDIVQEIESGTVTANYIRTLNIDEPLARIKSDGTVRYYQQDALGSVIALTDETGAIKTQYIYDPYGNVTISGEASDNPFQYTGRENDGTGLLYYRARYYSPELQRFTSEDPIRFRGGINFYRYVGNRPTRYSDPLGLLNILGGVGGSLVGITGVEGSVGQVCNTDAFKAATKGDLLGALGNVGYFGAGGAGGGVNVSADIFFGYIEGGIENVSGTTANLNLALGPVSITVFIDPNTGNVIGGTLGVGPSATVVGASGTVSRTGTITIREIISVILGAFR